MRKKSKRVRSDKLRIIDQDYSWTLVPVSVY